MTTDPRERLIDLLCTEATQELTPAEARELERLLAQFPDQDPDTFALAAAAADIALAGNGEPLPPELAATLRRDAAVFFATNQPVPAPASQTSQVHSWRLPLAGWAVAAGLAAVLAWSNWPKPVPANPTTAELLARLKQAPGTKAFAAEEANAEVLWNAEKQEGFLTVGKLPPLDPTREQYQLWIVDAGRQGKEPVDAGVFDVKPDGTAVIPVKAALKVKDAQVFAVTKEVAGGVVVTQGPMVLVFKPKAG